MGSMLVDNITCIGRLHDYVRIEQDTGKHCACQLLDLRLLGQGLSLGDRNCLNRFFGRLFDNFFSYAYGLFLTSYDRCIRLKS